MTSRVVTRRDDPGALAGVLTGMTFVGALVGAMKLARTPIPRPGAPADAVRAYYTDSVQAARFSVAGQAVSILCLLRFTTSVARLANDAGEHSGPLRATVLATGATSAGCLTISAATHAVLTVDRDRTDERVRALARRVFVAGGPVHGVVYGLFIVTLATVARRSGLWGGTGLCVGIASGLAGALSPAYFRWESAGWLIPIGRFSGYLLTAVAGARLARPRSDLARSQAPRA